MQKRNRYHRFIFAGAAAASSAATVNATLISLSMTSDVDFHTHSPPTHVVPQNQCLIPDHSTACITSSTSSLKLQTTLQCRDGRVESNHYYPYNATYLPQYLNAIVHHCRGGSTSADASDPNIFCPQPQQQHSPTPHHDHPHFFPPITTTRLNIEFDTRALMSGGVLPRKDDTLRRRLANRIGGVNDTEWMRRRIRHQHFPSLSITFDINPVSSSSANNLDSTAYHESNHPFHNDDQTLHLASNVVRPLAPIPTTITLLTQTASLLPPLILARRTLNFTWTAIVDYFRGRTIRTTFTKLERVYLRYYEFPAVIRAISRIGSQIGILLGLSWVVRLWIIWVCSSNDVSWPSITTLGIIAGIDNMSSVGLNGGNGDAGSRSGSAMLLGPGFTVGLPCHQRGKGIAWLCGFIWIAAVVGIGHACAMAVSCFGN